MKTDPFELDEKQKEKLNAVFSYAILKALYKDKIISLIEFKKMINKLNSSVNINLT